MIEIGSEKRFFDFIGHLDEKDKIVLISHVDLDGIGAAKIANSVIDTDLIKFLQYNEINNDLVEILKVDGYNKIIVTDLYIEDESVLRGLEKFADILILDHHPAEKDWNSDKIIYIKAEAGYCATDLCYRLFGKVKNLENLDWLVACACIADFCNVKNKDWIEEVFSKYNQKRGEYMNKIGFDYEDINKSEIYELQWVLGLGIIYFKENLRRVFDSIGEGFGEIGDLKKFTVVVQGEINNTLEKFEKERIKIENGFLFIFKPRFSIGSIFSNIISSKNPRETVIIIRDRGNGYVISARRQDSKIDMGVFVKKLLNGLDEARGGGHREAAGGFFLKTDLEKIKERLGVD